MTVKKLMKSVTLYPVTVMWSIGALIAIGISQVWFSLTVGLMILSIMTIIVLLVAVSRELHLVHHLVNSQRDELLLRIDHLVQSLTEAGVALPPGEPKTRNKKGKANV